MLASCSVRSSSGRPGAIDPTSTACWCDSALGAVSEPIRLMIANSALAPSDTPKTTTISQPSIRLVSGGRVAGTAAGARDFNTPGLYAPHLEPPLNVPWKSPERPLDTGLEPASHPGSNVLVVATRTAHL